MSVAIDETSAKKATDKPDTLRDSIVRRLKAHDAAVRSTLSTDVPKKTAPTNDQ